MNFDLECAEHSVTVQQNKRKSREHRKRERVLCFGFYLVIFWEISAPLTTKRKNHSSDLILG